MKSNFTRFMSLLAFMAFTTSVMGQEETKKKEEYRIKTVTVKDGQKVVVDTAFSSQEDLQKFMEEKGMKMPQIPKDLDVEMEMDEDVINDTMHIKRIRKLIEYRTSDSAKTISGEIDEEIEVSEEMMEKIKKLTESGIDLQNPEEIREYLVTDGVKADVQVIIIQRKIEIKEITSDDSKQANLKLPKTSEALQMTMSPNPATNSVSLNLDNESESETSATVQILDMTGKLVREDDFELQGNQVEVGLEDLPSGSYIVHLSSEGRSAYRKLIIE